MKKALFAALCLLSATSANAVTIDFEDYTDPTNVPTLTDSGATFQGTGDSIGLEVSAYSAITPTWGTAAPMVLCSRAANEYCGGSLEVDFSAAVSGLQFYFSADDEDTTLSVEAFLGAASLGSLTFSGDADPFTAHLADLSGLGLIDRIVVTTPSDEFLGYVYDDFSFAFEVPEPGTWMMLLLGFGAIGGALRRKRLTGSAMASA